MPKASLHYCPSCSLVSLHFSLQVTSKFWPAKCLWNVRYLVVFVEWFKASPQNFCIFRREIHLTQIMFLYASFIPDNTYILVTSNLFAHLNTLDQFVRKWSAHDPWQEGLSCCQRPFCHCKQYFLTIGFKHFKDSPCKSMSFCSKHNT